MGKNAIPSVAAAAAAAFQSRAQVHLTINPLWLNSLFQVEL